MLVSERCMELRALARTAEPDSADAHPTVQPHGRLAEPNGYIVDKPDSNASSSLEVCVHVSCA